ncbi:unnamed protein product [Schistosoma curassoni]|uniref:Uncharacterized protein n=1 Tax=Schistosoma curassoni TaxID=6186 RepID=A0A183KN36_9TREM|nr:unnamed protein product [Schistosoma curassoni]
MTDVLLIQVPSGKIRIGSAFGVAAWFFNLLAVERRSKISSRSNQTAGTAHEITRSAKPKNPPCFCPTCCGNE